MALKKCAKNNAAWINHAPLFVFLLFIPTFANAMAGTTHKHTNHQDTSSSDTVDSEIEMIPPEELVQPIPDHPQAPSGKNSSSNGAHKRNKRMLYGSRFIDPKNSYKIYPVIKYFVTISHAHQCTLRMAERFFTSFRNLEVKLSDDVVGHCVMPYDNPRCGGSMIAPRVVLTACHCLATFWDFDEEKKLMNPTQKDVWEDHNLIFRPGMNDEIVTDKDETWWKEHTDEYLATTSLAFTTFELFLFSKKYYINENCKQIKKRVFSYDFGFIFLSKDYLKIPDYVQSTRPSVVPTPEFEKKQRLIFAPVVTRQTLESSWGAVQRHQTTCLMVGTGWSFWAHGAFQALPPPGLIKYTWRNVVSHTFCARFLEKKLDLDPWNVTFWKDVMLCEEGYNDCATWDCTLETGRIKGLPALGDDGAPVVCDHLLYGIISASWPPDAFPASEIVLINNNVFNFQFYAESRRDLLALEEGMKLTGNYDLPPSKGPNRRQFNLKSDKLEWSAATRGITLPRVLIVTSIITVLISFNRSKLAF